MSDSDRKQMNFYVAPETKEIITKITKNLRTTPGLVLDVIIQNADLDSLADEQKWLGLFEQNNPDR